jgi:NADH-ubiquinone oxidoreductase chain 2
MLVLTVLTLLIATPLASSKIAAVQFMRLTCIAYLFAVALTVNCWHPAIMQGGLSLYSGLFLADSFSLAADSLICLAAALALLPWPGTGNSLLARSFGPGKAVAMGQAVKAGPVAEYPMLTLFSTIGSLLLVCSADLVSMYLAIELQSFALYVMAASYRNHEAATAAGLKYFLLGALSSALILFGSALLYYSTGLTNLQAISALLAAANDHSTLPIAFLFMAIGFLFKVSAAPFHNWAPDVYNGVPTIVTTWLAVLPKIAVLALLFSLTVGTFASQDLWQALLLVSCVLSLIIGTVLGLAQTQIKRLLAYSTVSHVGFMLLALATVSFESAYGLLFYVLQYTLTSVATFFILLAFGYVSSRSASHASHGSHASQGSHASHASHANAASAAASAAQGQHSPEPVAVADVQLIATLRAQFLANPLLAFSLLVCLFSMAGVPPMIGFFAKFNVLYVAMMQGQHLIALVAVLTSVISAAYYLRVVNVLYFNAKPATELAEPAKAMHGQEQDHVLTSLHSYVIAALTMFMALYVLNPSLLVNSTQLIAMTVFAT